MRRSKASGLGIASICLLAGAVCAQEAATPLGQAVSQGGGSSLQVGTANSVQRVCRNLAQAGGLADLARAPSEYQPASPREDLFLRCNEMVDTGLNVLGQAGLNSMGWDGASLAAAMNQLGGEENGSKTRLATETSNGQFANIGLRLDALARGARATSGGLATAGRSLGTTGGNAGDRSDGGWGWFANAAVGFGEREATLAENEYEFDSNGITVGADYLLGNGLVLGAAVGFADFDVDFASAASASAVSTVSGGGIAVDGHSLSFFGLAQPGRVTIDGAVIVGRNDFETTRLVEYAAGPDATGRADGLAIDRSILGKTKSDQIAAGINVGTSFNWTATTLYVDAGLAYLDVDVNAYTEDDPAPNGGLNLSFDEQNISSRQARLSAHVTRAFGTRNGVLSPFLQVEYRREFENDAQLHRARYANALTSGADFDLAFATDAPDESFFETSLGLVLVLRNNFQFIVDYRTSVGLRFADASLMTFSFRGAL